MIRVTIGVAIVCKELTSGKKDSCLKDPKPIRAAKQTKVTRLNSGNTFLRSRYNDRDIAHSATKTETLKAKI